MAYGVIYLLIDGINDKEYVGQTKRNVKKRFKEHTKADSYIGNVIRSHGADMFVIAILKECSSKKELDYWEKLLIKSRDTVAPNGYNLTKCGKGIIGYPFMPKQRAKIVASHIGIPCSPHTCSKISSTQRKESPFKNLIMELDRRLLSYNALAKLMNLSRKIISSKMQGKQNFSETEWTKLLEIFNKPAEYLMQRNDGKKNSVSKRHSSPFKNLLFEIDQRHLTYSTLEKLMNLSPSLFSIKMRGICNFSETEWAKLVEIFAKPAEYLMARCDNLPAITSKAEKNIKISAARRSSSPFKNLLFEIDHRHLTYTTLAKLMNLSLSLFSVKMHGKKKFTAEDIAKLVEIFAKPAEYLMARDDLGES